MKVVLVRPLLKTDKAAGLQFWALIDKIRLHKQLMAGHRTSKYPFPTQEEYLLAVAHCYTNM